MSSERCFFAFNLCTKRLPTNFALRFYPKLTSAGVEITSFFNIQTVMFEYKIISPARDNKVTLILTIDLFVLYECLR